MIGPTDLLHPSQAPHFKTFHEYLPIIDTKIITESVSVSVGGKVYKVQPTVRQRCEGK